MVERPLAGFFLPGVRASSALRRSTVTILLVGMALVVCTPSSHAQDGSSNARDTLTTREWNTLRGSWGEATLLGVMMIDLYRYAQDDVSRDQVGDLDDFEVPLIRTIRIGATGQFNFERPWTWVFSMAYRGFDRGFDRRQTDTWTVFDAVLRVPVGGAGVLGIGRQKEPFSLERLMNGLFLPFMERAAGLDALLQSRNNGFTFSRSRQADNQRITWSVGWFPGWMEGDELLSQRNQYTGRITGLIVDGDDSALHLGLSTRFSTVTNGTDVIARFKSTPESFGAPNFVDTGDFPADLAVHLGTEGYWRKGRFWLGTEAIMVRTDAPLVGDPNFWSFHTQVGWVLTGETRPYDAAFGVFSPWVPARDVSSGGPGLWEVAFRYSHTDLQDADVMGGVLDRWTAAISWTPVVSTKVGLNYGIARVSQDQAAGVTHIGQVRLQLYF